MNACDTLLRGGSIPENIFLYIRYVICLEIHSENNHLCVCKISGWSAVPTPSILMGTLFHPPRRTTPVWCRREKLALWAMKTLLALASHLGPSGPKWQKESEMSSHCLSALGAQKVQNRIAGSQQKITEEYQHCVWLDEQGRALYGPIPVKTETFRELWAPLVHTNFGGNSYGPIIGPYLFLGKFVWTNGPESSSKVSPYTGIGPWMALPRRRNHWTERGDDDIFSRLAIVVRLFLLWLRMGLLSWDPLVWILYTQVRRSLGRKRPK